MSISVTMYYCTACDFEQGDAGTWGIREYVLPNGVRIPVEWNIGWCESCNGIAPIEDLSSQVRIQKYREAQRGLHHMPDDDHSMQQKYEEWMQDAIDALEMLSTRKSPPHCLHCSSTQVHVPENQNLDCDELLNSDYVVDASAQPTELSELGSEVKTEKYIWQHIGCGGQIRTKPNEDGLSIAMWPSVHRYTPEGLVTEQEYVDGYTAPEHGFWDALSESNRRIRELDLAAKKDELGGLIPNFLRKSAD